jgi:transposase
LQTIRGVPVHRLVFLDESGMNVTMSRSHAWVRKGEELVDRIPMNRGKSLTLLGAIRRRGWVLLSTMWKTANADRFVAWLKRKLLPKLDERDVLVMDNLPAHRDPRVAWACAEHGTRLIYLPPHSPDFNPIEPGWALQKQHVRKHAPRNHDTLRRVARRARYRVTRRHCANWFAHAGYGARLR